MQTKLLVAGLTLVIGCATPTVLKDVHQSAVERSQLQEAARSVSELTLAHELPDTPPDVVATLVDLLAGGGPVAQADGCLLFTESAAHQFAEADGQPTCIAAMRQLQGEVSDPDAYANDLTVPATAWTQAGNVATVDGGEATWTGLFTEASLHPPGPQPGLMILNRLDDYGWQITNYQPC